MIYIAFTVCMGLLFLLFYDSIFDGTKNKKENENVADHSTKKEAGVSIKKTPLEVFLDDHVKHGKITEFKTLKGSSNGYYYGTENFSVSLFQYGEYRTAQLFQQTPYILIADMKTNENAFSSIDVHYKDVPEELKSEIKVFFERIAAISLISNSTDKQDSVEEILGRIRNQLKSMDQHKNLLSTEQKHYLRQTQTFDVPELMHKFYSLQGYNMEAEKLLIQRSLKEVEEKINKQWFLIMEQKNKEEKKLG